MIFRCLLILTCMVVWGWASATGQAHPDSQASVGHHGSHNASEPTPFDKTRNAQADVDLVLADAKDYGKLGLIVMGANWCHDSRALATHFEKPRFQTLLNAHYKMTYVDVGRKNRNIDIARRFGLDSIVGTPTVIVTNSEGQVLNLETAPTWRNAASRTEDEVWQYFKDWVHSDSQTADLP